MQHRTMAIPRDWSRLIVYEQSYELLDKLNIICNTSFRFYGLEIFAEEGRANNYESAFRQGILS